MNNRLVTVTFSLCLIALNAFPQEAIEQAKADIERLTSREFAGRGIAFDGNQNACVYLKERFRQIGLNTAGEEYGQPFDIELNVIEGIPTLSINNQALSLGTDFLPFGITGSGSCEGDAPIYYVKSGLFVPEKDINDYGEVKQPGAILIFEDEVPAAIRDDKSIDPRSYSRETRIQIAKILKASGAIFLVQRLMYSTPYSHNDLPVFDVLKTSFPNPVRTISFEVESDFDEYESENVVGVLRGTSQTDSTIIVCAHYDHVDAFADSLYFPGANDNASGVAMLLGLAQYLRADPLKYSVVFIAFSGEEAGLVGSRYYAEHPLLPLDRTSFLLNLDMVASGNDGVMAVGGDDFPDFYSKLKTVNDSLNLGPLYKRWNAPNGDHYSLSKKGIKVFFLYANQGTQPYHSFQDLTATLDWKAFDHIFQLAKGFLRSIAD